MPLSPQYYLSDAAELESLAYRTTDFRETALRIGAPSGHRAEHSGQHTDGERPIP